MRLHDFFDYHCREHPHAPFATHHERQLTFRRAAPIVHQLANSIIESGMRNGDRVAVISRNCIEFLLLYLAASKSGVVLVPMNYRLAPAQWLHILRDSGARLLFVEELYCPEIDPLKGDLPEIEQFVSLLGEVPGWTLIDQWISRAPADPPDRIVESQDVAYQMYTSGTTGLPKGALIRQSSVTYNCLQIEPALPEIAPGDSYLLVAPVYHAAAAITFFSTLFRGGCLHLQEKFEAVRVVEAMSNGEVVGALLVPSMIQACLTDVPDVHERSYPSLRTISYGASAISEETLRKAMDTFGCEFVQGYGMTETTAVLTVLTQEDHRRALREKPHLLNSAGRPVMGTELRIVDQDDNPLACGQVGQIVVRGPQVMKGYWNRPEATEETLAGGWMHTGDAGKVDEEGYLYIMDRVKDIIISGAENIYPRAIEEVLFSHPEVADAAVIGVPHQRWGETVKAIVVVREGCCPEAEELIDFCRARLGGFQVPRSVDFIAELPRNPSGKVLKRVLRKPYWRGHKRQVS